VVDSSNFLCMLPDGLCNDPTTHQSLKSDIHLLLNYDFFIEGVFFSCFFTFLLEVNAFVEKCFLSFGNQKWSLGATMYTMYSVYNTLSGRVGWILISGAEWSNQLLSPVTTSSSKKQGQSYAWKCIWHVSCFSIFPIFACFPEFLALVRLSITST
jgi:hypothetical protein